MANADDQAQVQAQLTRRRSAVAAAWELTDEVVLIGAGELIPIPGRPDGAYPFRAHPEYYYLTDRNRPGGVLAFDPHEGWVDFVEPIPATERLWLGTQAEDPAGPTTEELESWVAARRRRPIACLGFAWHESDPALTDHLRAPLDRVRRPKDPLADVPVLG